MAKNKNTIDMTEGPLLKNIFLFCLPLMATNLLQMLFNAADTIVVGRFAGAEALAAVGATGSICFLIVSLFFGMSTGTNVVIANAIGARDYERVSKGVHTSMVLSVVTGFIPMVIGIFFSRNILRLIATPDNIIDGSTIYMQIYFGGAIFLLVYNFGAAILRSKGDTKRPLYFLMVSGVLNVLLNLLFVIVFKLAVVGVALATVISHAVSAFLVVYVLLRSDDECKLYISKLKMDAAIVAQILKIGIPAGIQGAAFALSNVVVQSSINSFDSSDIVAGNTAAINIENFVYIGMMAFANAAMTFTSQNMGAKNLKNIKKIAVTTMILNVTTSIVVGVLAYMFGDVLLGLFTTQQNVIEIGKIRLWYVVVFLFLNAILDIFSSSLRGMGYSTSPTIIMLLGVCGLRIAYLMTVFPLHRTIETIYLCYPVSWLVTSLALFGQWIVLYRRVQGRFVSASS